jgi:cytochrome c
MMRAHLIAGLVLLAAAPAAALAAGDAKRGAQVFRQCMACHSTEEGEHMTGPSLAQIWGRKAGTVEGFRRYSDAIKHATVTWNEATLDKWLADPERFIPGTTMTFAGLKQPRDRQDVAAYLKALAEQSAPQAARGEQGMMGMRGGKADLRKAPPQAQVKALSHCGDTYTVETADGKKNKVWEFNLRLKTDSSKLGPLPGNPVVVGAGMQGDRASIVFASPKEISGFIKQSCP